MTEKIVTAALRLGELILTVRQPGRHHTVFWAYDDLTGRPIHEAEQGFMTSTGRFVDRHEGCRIARAADQIVRKHGPDDTLFSEDMW